MLNFIPHKIKVVEIMKKITVTNIDISISVRPDNNDYICLTDMAHFKDRERTNYIIQNWMRLRSTIDFLGLWEKLNNPNFKGIEFDAFKIWIVQLFPKPKKFNGIPIPHPVLDDVIHPLRVPIAGHVGQADVILILAGIV